MEAINDSSRLIAQALQIVKHLEWHNISDLQEVTKLLEEALEKLAKNISCST